MPLAVFFVTFVFSSLLFLTSFSVVVESKESSAGVDSHAAFLASLSETELAWADDVLSSSSEVLQSYSEYEKGRHLSAIALNQGIELESAYSEKKVSTESFLEAWYQSNAELLMFDVSPDQVVDTIGLDYCLGRRSRCPEIVLEWFQFDRHFRFQELTLLVDRLEMGQIKDTCVSWSEYGVRRCVWKPGMDEPPELDFTPFLNVDFWHSIRLETHFPSYRYLLRVRAVDNRPFHFRPFAMRGGEKVPLPQAVFEVDQLSQGRNSFRRVRDQKQLSAGLQDGLGFVHYAHEVEDK